MAFAIPLYVFVNQPLGLMTHFALNEFYDFYNRNYGERHTHCNYVFFKGDMLEFEHIGDNRHVNDTGAEYPAEYHGTVQIYVMTLYGEDGSVLSTHVEGVEDFSHCQGNERHSHTVKAVNNFPTP